MQPERGRVRQTGMRPTFLAVLALLFGLAVAPYPQSPARASCVGPTLAVEKHAVLEQATTLTVDGKWFVDGCADTGTCRTGPGCDDCEPEIEQPEPMTDVYLELRQGGRRFVLGAADAGEDGRITWEFQLPEGVRPGRAVLGATRWGPVVVRIR